jgi:hypothetical protein
MGRGGDFTMPIPVETRPGGLQWSRLDQVTVVMGSHEVRFLVEPWFSGHDHAGLARRLGATQIPCTESAIH